MGSFVDGLAERIGIESSFLDAAQQEHETPGATKQALLKAMGWAAANEHEAEASLQRWERTRWEQVLPACAVLYADRDLSVPVCLPPEHGSLRWTVVLEDSSERSGEADFASLHLLETGTFDGEPRERRALALPEDLPWGYHQLRLRDFAAPETSLIVTPGRCWLPGDEATNGRFWGVAVQMYLLRSERNWGIGDYTDLRHFVEIVREHGAGAVGVNPLHGMFSDSPEQCSPYSPLSRYLLTVLCLDVEAIPEFATSDAGRKLVEAQEFQQKLSVCRNAPMVAYEDVSSLKQPVLQALFLDFERSAGRERKDAFRAFRHECDELLRVSCVFSAIRQYLTDQNPAFRDCGRWPEEFTHATSPGVLAFSRNHAELVRYHLWLQWIADDQMAGVKRACEDMPVGLYRDLAVGASPSGAEVWSNPQVMVSTAEVGAPPDILNTAGQNWALPPFHPQEMKEDGYRSYIALLRTNMRHAGGIRIDHAMALHRLYWIPRGGSPRDGGYVRYPTEDLIGVIALESHRNRCLVVGEDLGTVPKGFRERMAEAQILSYKVLLLEEEETGGAYVDGTSYQRLALSTASSHDLPTLRGWWEEVDLALRERLGLSGPEAAARNRAKRKTNREALVTMFGKDGLLDRDAWPDAAQFTDAAHRFLLRTSSVLMMAQLEDILEETEQVNLPASMPDQYPSWSRRVTTPLEALAQDPRLLRLASFAREERGALVTPGR